MLRWRSAKTADLPDEERIGSAESAVEGEFPIDASAQAVPPASPEGAVKHSVHHSYMWLGSIRTAVVILFAAAVSMGSSLVGIVAGGTAGSPEDMFITLVVLGVCALAVLVVIAIAVVYQVVSYKHLWYELADEEFSLHSGILSKKCVHVPYRRIQSVDQRASLFQRIFGVCTVSIDTAGGSNNKAVQIPYVQKSQAEKLRAELFMRKKRQMNPESFAASSAGAGNVLDMPAGLWDEVRGVFAGEEVDTGQVAYEYGLTNKELVLTGLSNNTAFVLIVVGVITAIFQVIGAIIPLLFGEAAPVVDVALTAGMRLFGGSLMAVLAIGAVGFMLIVWLLSAVGSCISYGGFRCCRRDNRIEVERGLLQHQFQGVNVDRVQSITVRQTFVRRLLGYCEVSLGKIDAAQENSDGQQSASLQQGLVIHPFVKLSRVPEILAGIVPEFAGVPVDVRPVAPVALRRAIIRKTIIQGGGFWLALTVAAFQIMLHAVSAWSGGQADASMSAFVRIADVVAVACYVLAVILTIINVADSVLWHRESGFAYNRSFMQISNGGLARETVSFPRKKIQFGYTKTNPFQRRARTATLNVRTAAGIGGTTVRLIDVPEELARDWLSWLQPRGAYVPLSKELSLSADGPMD